ncbi:integrase [Paraburkholderia caffeinilytica]|uniref:Phage-related integrase n=1 Tax=Paraburkholderia caffeinilytica TaxID=1761016 RepID=A0ABQ1MD96_9BURK|nr:tyrosine-type recombinase/integrase [Paraburkholderia caffeinilytica]AXL52303.1 integrase [Paraburkholderia caffeinilytica]GGC36690.1 phage-related integrase [Paraburkholderia caffeinilytica]CAB3791439.1 Tyrosine recombinase XerC [Paraburkholderia caffeinilytica]
MATTINSKTSRDKLAPRREPYWSRIQAGLYVGYRKPTEGEGTWIARRRNEDGKQQYRALGTLAAYDDAARAASEWANAIDAGVSSKGMTVKEACEHYVKHLGLHKGAASKADAEGRFRRLVYDAKIGRVDLSKLRTSEIKTWLSAQIEIGESDAEDEDDLRRAKDSANRNLASLKAALNLALHDRLVATDAGWKTVAKFKDVGRRRQSFLSADQRKALIHACACDIKQLATAMLLTGARPGELANASVGHFDREQGTLSLEGKTGHRVITLSSAAIAFFTEQTKNKIGNAPILATEFGQRWNKDSWKKPFRTAVLAAKLPSTVVMYTLRHTAISEFIANGADSFIVARLAGTSTAMIDKHYGHLRHDKTRAKLDAIAIL